jgi:hypothetical protein
MLAPTLVYSTNNKDKALFLRFSVAVVAFWFFFFVAL